VDDGDGNVENEAEESRDTTFLMGRVKVKVNNPYTGLDRS